VNTEKENQDAENVEEVSYVHMIKLNTIVKIALGLYFVNMVIENHNVKNVEVVQYVNII
jgi:hypothetical protein